jgi:hypothetical protein
LIKVENENFVKDVKQKISKKQIIVLYVEKVLKIKLLIFNLIIILLILTKSYIIL